MTVPTSHPVLDAVEAVRSVLKDVAGVNPTFMDVEVLRSAVGGLEAARAQLDELVLRLVAAAVEVAETDTARDVAAWRVARHHRDARTARAEVALAAALDRRYGLLRAGMAEGRVHLDQASVIARALDDLPAEVSAETVARAEVALVDLAEAHTPRELARLGRRILDVVAPHIAEAALARRLQDEESGARHRTRLTFKTNGDGTTRISAVVPDATATRLKTYLEAFTSPRRGELRGQGPYPRILGEAFCALLERVDPTRLPQHGGRATTVVVTIDVDSLRRDLGVGELTGGQALSATEVRRLACTASIVPAVLGGKGEVLDLGRERRLFTPAQQLALIVRDRTCRAEGCDQPGSWCEAHHWSSWARGGRTDLDNAVLLCSYHHHRVHDPRYTSQRLPDGTVSIVRRR